MTGDRSEKGPKGRDAIEEIARRLGNIVEAVEDAIQGGGSGDHGRDFTIDTPTGPLTGRYGMTVKSASPRQRQGQPPTGGRRQAADESSAHPTNREPMIELFDEPDEFVVTADIPGLQLAEIAAKCETGELVLTIKSPAMTGPATHRAAPSTRRLAIAALTPAHSARVRVNHGILEIRIAKQASQNPSS